MIAAKLHLIKFSQIANNGLSSGFSGTLSECNFFIGKEWYGVSNLGLKKGDQLVPLFPQRFIPFILRKKGNYSEMVGTSSVLQAMRERAIRKIAREASSCLDYSRLAARLDLCSQSHDQCAPISDSFQSIRLISMY